MVGARAWWDKPEKQGEINRCKQVLFIGPLCDQMDKSSSLSIAAVR